MRRCVGQYPDKSRTQCLLESDHVGMHYDELERTWDTHHRDVMFTVLVSAEVQNGAFQVQLIGGVDDDQIAVEKFMVGDNPGEWVANEVEKWFSDWGEEMQDDQG